MSEEWRPVPGYEDRYLVSNLGRVMSLPNRSRFTKIVLRLRKNARGYLVANLYTTGKAAHRPTEAHRLVLLAFVGPAPEGKPFGCHIDGVKTNNVLENLYWGSPAENAKDSVRQGLMPRGERNTRSKITDAQAKAVKELLRAGGMKQREIAAAAGVSLANVHQIKSGRTWAWME